MRGKASLGSMEQSSPTSSPTGSSAHRSFGDVTTADSKSAAAIVDAVVARPEAWESPTAQYDDGEQV